MSNRYIKPVTAARDAAEHEVSGARCGWCVDDPTDAVVRTACGLVLCRGHADAHRSENCDTCYRAAKVAVHPGVVTGEVESIEFIREDAHRRILQSGHYETPIVVKATIKLEDGRRAYVETLAGTWYFHDVGGGGNIEGFRMTEGATDPNGWTAEKGARVRADAWPWAIPAGMEVLSGSNFGLAIHHYAPTVWLRDRVTVRGSLSERTSQAGHDYVTVKRARVIALERAEGKWEAPHG
jgi:hypothetical protein